jgi:NAD(P)H-hydrate epimerase
MITGSEMAVVDENAAALGVPRKQLMESSGNAVARAVTEIADPGSSVFIIAGRGNNGGDAFVTARFLDDYDLSVALLGRAERISTDIARENWAALTQAGYDTTEIRDSTQIPDIEADVVVDAMLGTGVTGALREPAATAAAAINESDATVVAVDVPSGFDAETGVCPDDAVAADHVVTFHDMKPGLDALSATVTVADIGIPAAAERVVERGDLSRLQRDPASHKGDNGEVLVVGGGPYTGAPALAARAALRAGADLVRVACPSTVADTVQGYTENLIIEPFPGDRFRPEVVASVRDRAAAHDAVVLGPGLGDDSATRNAVRSFLTDASGRVVVDADALQALPGTETEATVIATPHREELAGMGGPPAEEDSLAPEAVAAYARDLGQTLLVKGATDIISNGDRTRHNHSGNPGMTVGGTGDVLAGTTGALATSLDPLDAAAVGAYATGRAGDEAIETHGNGLVATDVLERVPAALWPPEESST